MKIRIVKPDAVCWHNEDMDVESDAVYYKRDTVEIELRDAIACNPEHDHILYHVEQFIKSKLWGE